MALYTLDLIFSSAYVARTSARIWCSIGTSLIAECGMFSAMHVYLAGGHMTIWQGDDQATLSKKESFSEAADSACAAESGHGLSSAQSITEISDKDYRSFWLPCDALQDADKRRKGN